MAKSDPEKTTSDDTDEKIDVQPSSSNSTTNNGEEPKETLQYYNVMWCFDNMAD
ncbi:hypothetical protein D3C80_2240080 [compost metagenome]